MSWIMKKLSFLFCLLLSSYCAFAQPQNTFSTGLDLDDQAYQNMDELQADGSKARLPSEVSLYQYAPTPRNQGRAQSCVGWAVGYSALTIEKAIQYQLKDRERITQYAFSALYVYNQIKEGDCLRNGSRITDALDFLQQNGNVMAGQFDLNVEDCGRQVTPELMQYAQRFRITDHLKLFPVDEVPAQKVFKVKYALSKQKPVIIGMKIRKNFFQLNARAKFWWPEIGDKTSAGGHAMTVIGYDDQRAAFLLMNSWGQKWGLGGFMWVKYEVFAEFCKYAFILQVEEGLDGFWDAAYEAETNAALPQNTPQNTPSSRPAKPTLPIRPRVASTVQPVRKMAGAFNFKYNPEVNQYSSFFDAAAVTSQGFYYQLQRKDWRVGQQFQLEVDNLERNAYVYVVSVNNDGQVYIHWPRKEALNPRFKSQNESALILENQSRITIPGPKRALKIASPGKDHLVILFSKKPLKGLVSLLSQLEGHQDDLPETLMGILKPFMVPLSDIEYARDRVAFSVNTRSEGIIVPLIIEVNSVK
jgi:hypothetical protein